MAVSMQHLRGQSKKKKNNFSFLWLVKSAAISGHFKKVMPNRILDTYSWQVMWFEHSNITREEGITHQNEAWIPPSQSAAQDSAVTFRLCFHMCTWGSSSSKKRIANSNTASHRLCFQSPDAAVVHCLAVIQQILDHSRVVTPRAPDGQWPWNSFCFFTFKMPKLTDIWKHDTERLQ